MRFAANKPGTLPSADNAVVAGVELPSGLLIAPDPLQSGGPATTSPQPVLWITKDPVAKPGALWTPLAARFAEHGLWPLVLESLGGADERPWLCGEIDPSFSTAPDRHDAPSVLEEQWSRNIPEDGEEEEALDVLAPFDREFPGLAPATIAAADPRVFDAVVAELSGRLGLVAAARPADTLAALGWMGPANAYSDMGLLSSVLRSWEDRFGAYVVGIGFDTLTLAVERPPRTRDGALAIAAEHFAMCPDNVWQGAGTIDEYAQLLVGNTQWSFWWD